MSRQYKHRLTALLVSIALASAGCGGATPSPAPEDLAILTTRGLYLWSSQGHTRRLSGFQSYSGKTAIRLLDWSADGRDLAWMEERLTTGTAPRLTLRWFDTATGHEHSWPLAQTLGAPSALLASGNGLTGYFPGINTSASELRRYQINGASSAVPLIIDSYEALSDTDGFIAFGPGLKLGMYAVHRVALDGSAQGITIAMRSSHPAEQALEHWAVSPSGMTLAAEQGDHTDGCGVGPASQVAAIDPRSAEQSLFPLPGGKRWRVVSMGYSPDGVLLVVAADTTAACAGGQPTASMPTTLFELNAGTLHAAAHQVLIAARSPRGLLAVITGQWRLGLAPGGDYPATLPSGPQTLRVGSHTIKLPGTPTTLVWSPNSASAE